MGRAQAAVPGGLGAEGGGQCLRAVGWMSHQKIQMTGTMLSHSPAPPAASAYSGREEEDISGPPLLGEGGAEPGNVTHIKACSRSGVSGGLWL